MHVPCRERRREANLRTSSMGPPPIDLTKDDRELSRDFVSASQSRAEKHPPAALSNGILALSNMASWTSGADAIRCGSSEVPIVLD